jgi:DNA helicase-2/ATP-dependent DNA helicase PcrA
MSEALPPYLEVLNPEQREAVFHEGSPLLILAGAGSGKTRVITTKIGRLISERRLEPYQILAVTFTNKAAREMAERAVMIDPRASGAVLRTFHSFGAWFLRRHGSLAGLNAGFVIYDDEDAASLLGSLIEDASRTDTRAWAAKISRAKDYFLGPDDPELDLIDYDAKFREIYRRYEERLTEIGNVDFGDLIKKPVEILRAFPMEKEKIHRRFRVILVDEYQDSNIAQAELLKELAGPETYVCVVGDDDQSIYRFRGAEVKNILDFPAYFPGAQIIRLERNYRSRPPILALANSIVQHNGERLGKTLRAERSGGRKPVLAFLPDADNEAAFCARLIENDHAAGGLYSNWAITYRTNSQSLEFETELVKRRIPYRVIGSLKFYEREEIKDALALLAFLANPRDEVAFRRVVNKPARGVGPATVDKITIEALTGDGDLEAAALRLSVSAKARKGLETFLAPFQSLRPKIKEARIYADEEDSADLPEFRNKMKQKAAPSSTLRGGEGLSGWVVSLVKETGIDAYHYSEDDIAGGQRLANLQELSNAAMDYDASLDGLVEFLEHIELDRAAVEGEGSLNSVSLITLHNTKGLEFPNVIITGLEQGIFPWQSREDNDIEEERRLFYVGATRAMDELYLTCCRVRRRFGRTEMMEPSVFLGEIDPDCLTVKGAVPRAFRRSPTLPQRAPSGGQKSSDGRWQIGDTVFHDDHGYGQVWAIREGDDGPLIFVKFNNGEETSFFSVSQSSRYMKIGRED